MESLLDSYCKKKEKKKLWHEVQLFFSFFIHVIRSYFFHIYRRRKKNSQRTDIYFICILYCLYMYLHTHICVHTHMRFAMLFICHNYCHRNHCICTGHNLPQHHLDISISGRLIVINSKNAHCLRE